MDLELSGKSAFVVGATGDMGQAVVERLVDESARVVVAGRTAGKLADVFGSYGDALAGSLEIDLRDDASIEAAVAAAEELLDGIDVLVTTAAGEPAYAGVWGVTRADWESDLALKCIGMSRLCTHVARGMVERRTGTIVNLIGIATDMVVKSNPIGSASNSGLRSFTRVLAAEVAHAGVRVVGISPGFVTGQRLDRFGGDAIEELRAQVPLGSIGKPGEIADVAVFAASPRASYLTGAIVPVDGGVTLMR